jgi:hypothetical protein
MKILFELKKRELRNNSCACQSFVTNQNSPT